ncbi:MAG: phosphogluconate dehydrogenase (NAD(+)-dependent, decarboxylating) [Bacillota bacterium]
MKGKRYGIIGLGRMGGNLVHNLQAAGGEAVVYDLNRASVEELARDGAIAASSPADLAARLERPRIIWIMVPEGAPVDQVLSQLEGHIEPGDVVIDGGNSFYRDSVRRSKALEARGIHYLDCGSSGGWEGARDGLCLMVGGKPEAFALAEPFFRAVARQDGYAHVGPSGAGHFVKMVHNAIEYGMLEAIGEGFELLEAGPYKVDMAQVADLWNHGSVVRGWLMELAVRAFRQDPTLERITGSVGSGATGSWAIEEAWKAGVPFPAIATSYAMRLRSRQPDTFAGKVVAALRWEFGRHEVREK